jgi:hypothetical protein
MDDGHFGFRPFGFLRKLGEFTSLGIAMFNHLGFGHLS